MHVRVNFCRGKYFALWLVLQCDWLFVGLMMEDKLLKLCVIGNVPFVVKTTRLEACATHAPSPPCYEHKLKALPRVLVVHVALN